MLGSSSRVKLDSRALKKEDVNYEDKEELKNLMPGLQHKLF